MRMRVFSWRTMGFAGEAGAFEVWDAGTGPKTIGIRTDAGIVDRGAAGVGVVDGSACGGEVV